MENTYNGSPVLQNQAALKRIRDTYEKRRDAILFDYHKAMAISDEKERQFALERLYDEANGYTARVSPILARSERDYNKDMLPIKTLKNINEDIKRKFYVDTNLEKMRNHLTEARNFSCHPPYYPPKTFNHVFVNNILPLVDNAIDKIQTIETVPKRDELSLMREGKKQENTLVAKSLEFINRLDGINTCCDKRDLIERCDRHA